MSARPTRAPTAGQLALELPLELPPIDIAPEWKDQQRLWGHAFHPMCSYLASFPAALDARLHRPLLAPGRRRPRPVLRPRHDPAPGLRRGPDRRRQRPQPVRPPADRREGRAGDARAGGHAPGRAPARLERRLGRLAGARRHASPPTRRDRRRASRSPAPGRGPRRRRRDRPGRGRPRLPPADARPAAVRPDDAAPRRPDRPVPRRRDHRDPPRQERDATCPS